MLAGRMSSRLLLAGRWPPPDGMMRAQEQRSTLYSLLPAAQEISPKFSLKTHSRGAGRSGAAALSFMRDIMHRMTLLRLGIEYFLMVFHITKYASLIKKIM
jgi:hypothetical protein